MSRTEADREDLFAEATALRRRAELRVPDLPRDENPVVAGFHADYRAGLYFGLTAADHLDPAGRLTRAFRTVGGEHRLYRSQGETLAELTRRRGPDRTALVRRDLGGDELAAFLAAARARHAALLAALTGGAELARIAGADCRAELAAFLRTALPPDAPLAPRYKGKR